MCTVSIISVADDAGPPVIRMACNRDELRTRPAALPPEIRRCKSRSCILPVDPVSDGTWVAVNDAGIAATLLNVYPRPSASTPKRRGLHSRGEIILSLMHCDDFERAATLADQLDANKYPPFRLVIVTQQRLAYALAEGHSIQCARHDWAGEPLLFTTSGLGDELVDGPRRALFEQMFSPGGSLAARQDAFHRHRWPDRPNLSVNMSRAEACTVSLTVIEIRPHDVRLIYHPAAPDQPVEPMELSLHREAE